MTTLQRLTDYLRPLAEGGLCIAYSGGVDSAVVLKAARLLTGRVCAVTAATPLHPMAEPEQAARLAEAVGAEHIVLRSEEIPADVAENTPERCYLCKHSIFSRLKAYAEQRGFAHVLDGTNADDLNEYRPGLRALRELGVKSPLAELGIPKAEVRLMAEELGLSVAKKPSAPCLATRFPYYERIDADKLARAEAIEDYIKGMGFPVVRARIHAGILRLEVSPDRIVEAAGRAADITAFCKEQGVDYVTLDLEGFRSGSMDLHVKQG